MSTTDTPTPGETAYDAYWPALGSAPPVPWAGLSPVVHAAWEAAAQAVRDLVLRELVDGFAQATQERRLLGLPRHHREP